MTEVIILIANILIVAVVWFRYGRQNAINDLIKAYNNVCKDNKDKQIIINSLREQLKAKEEKQ